ncbi:MAG TPA: hypothetical protein VHY91_24470 [Pirellulales bacterium]|jgi:hypothetical protein|nr:hypothetical protein [Pirellulales bacterium]
MRRIPLITLTIALLATRVALAQVAATQSPPSSYEVIDSQQFELPRFLLVQLEPMQAALHESELQKGRQAKLIAQLREKIWAARRANGRDRFLAVRDEAEKTILGDLEPDQRARFDQIELQLQGPAVFASPDLPKRLELSNEQTQAVRAIANQANRDLQTAAAVPLPWKFGDSSVTEGAIREFVRSQQFVAARQRAWKAVFEGRSAARRQIEEKLTADQRAAYQKMLGEPIDVEKFLEELTPKGRETDRDIRLVARGLGLVGQRADPDFNVKVAQPAYPAQHPRVLFDEAHDNFHTTGGRFKAFTELITSDGYQVTPNAEKFTPAILAHYDILVIANATAGRGGENNVAKSAFTPDECQAVADWVEGGGSLLLVTDHEPFGSASNMLAGRFGVEMSNRVTSDPANGAERGLLFARDKERIGDHAITKGRDLSERVNRVLTFTGQSLKGPPGSVAFLKFADTAVERDGEKEISAAGRAQGVALTQGKGRVVVTGEAAELSAQIVGFPPMRFGMNARGCDNRQMVLSIMHWLSGLTK